MVIAALLSADPSDVMSIVHATKLKVEKPLLRFSSHLGHIGLPPCQQLDLKTPLRWWLLVINDVALMLWWCDIQAWRHPFCITVPFGMKVLIT